MMNTEYFHVLYYIGLSDWSDLGLLQVLTDEPSKQRCG